MAGGPEVGKRDQVLKVVSAPVQRIRKGPVVRESLFRIAIFQDAAGRIVSVVVHSQRIVSPHANFMRKRRYILRECADVVDVGGLGIRLWVADAAFRAMVSADTAAALCQVGVVKQEIGNWLG